MKIRTDFITNSSSTCITEIIIDNPVLLQILRKYVDLGLFKDNDPFFGVGFYVSTDTEYFSVGNYIGGNQVKTPAFFYFEKSGESADVSLVSPLEPINYDHDTGEFTPFSLMDVLEAIIEIINNGSIYLDPDLLLQMTTELNQKKEEIVVDFKNVKWRMDLSWDESGFTLYTYDPEQGSIFTSDLEGYYPSLCTRSIEKDEKNENQD